MQEDDPHPAWRGHPVHCGRLPWLRIPEHRTRRAAGSIYICASSRGSVLADLHLDDDRKPSYLSDLVILPRVGFGICAYANKRDGNNIFFLEPAVAADMSCQMYECFLLVAAVGPH